MISFLLLVSANWVNGQPAKFYYVYINPVACSLRNPTIGSEIFLKKRFIDGIHAEFSYKFRDNKVGRFWYQGYKEEKSEITPFVSYPINRYPVFVYNGFTCRVGMNKYVQHKKLYQYVAVSAIARFLSYDSLKVDYNHNRHDKRTSILEPVGYTTHFRTQQEQLKSLGAGLEYGMKKIKGEMMFNFFCRLDFCYTERTLITSHEEYNQYDNGVLIAKAEAPGSRTYVFDVCQIRPQIGFRVGFAN